MAENKDSYLLQLKQIGALTVVPIILLTGPVVGYFIGDGFDRKFQSSPWCTVLFVALGFVAAGREVFRLLKQILKEDNKKSSE